MKKLSSYKTADGAQGHREGAKNGIRALKNHLTYPESGSDAKNEKLREGAGWIKNSKSPNFIQSKQKQGKELPKHYAKARRQSAKTQKST